jgi:NADH-quinone oxidoreductase subunit G
LPKVTIDDRTVEVEAGTNLVDAAFKAGVHIPHYCYHPRLSVVGQCRMCLVKIDGMGKLQAGCSTPVVKDGMVVHTDLPEVREAQRGMMEFLLINHPLDCPICDQAGECALQDYAFKHGAATSRFLFEDKRTYPGRERIPLGGDVLLNMNRCIQCTRCVRFTEEIAKTGELGFFNRGARTEIGTFPGKRLDNPIATCVVDICPVGALTSTRFRFAERVFYLAKVPSLCTGCEVGCNITVEHRRGKIKRYKPRFNPEVNDYWMCDYGRGSFERYGQLPRLAAPRVGGASASWKEALDAAFHRLRGDRLESTDGSGEVAFLGSGNLSTEEAYLFARLADAVGAPHRSVAVELGPQRTIPNLKGGISGREAAPNRRGAELAGLGGPASTAAQAGNGRDNGGAAGAAAHPAGGNGGAGKAAALGATELITGEGAERCAVLVVCDSDLGRTAHDPAVVARLRRAGTLIVFGWADTPLARAADIALPVANHAEKDGTFVNVEWRVQRFAAAYPAPGLVRPGVEVLADLLARFDPRWAGLDAPAVFDRLAAELPAFAGLSWHGLGALGAPLAVPESHARAEPHVVAPEDTAVGI